MKPVFAWGSRKRILFSISVTVLGVVLVLVGWAAWGYYYEKPNASSIGVQVQNASPSNESGWAEVWVTMDGAAANQYSNPDVAALQIPPSSAESIAFSVSGEACQGHSISLYLNVGPHPQSHAVSTQSVTVCGGDHKLVVFTVTNTF